NQLAEAASDTNDTETLKGVAVSDLDENARGQFKVPANIKGALVTGVEEGSAAGEAGLKPGDVIMEINRKPVRSAEDAIKLTETARDGTTLVRVWGKCTSHYLIVNETKEG